SAPMTSAWIVKPTTKHTSDTLGGGGFSHGLLGFTLAILLGDAQPVLGNLNVAQVNLGIDSINVVYQGQVTNIATYSAPYVTNIMANGGDPSSMGIGQSYSGNYDHIQFVVDTASSNVVDASGNAYPIQFLVGQASQSTAGAGQRSVTTGNSTTVTMTVGGNFMIGGSPAAAVFADFNAFESLNQNSSGQIVAQPTLYAVGAANAAEIQGQVLNANGQPVCNAVIVALNANNRVANTTNTDVNGNFDLHAINAGSYQLVIYNNYTTASGQTITAQGADASTGASFQGPSVTAPAGEITQVGTLND
ncbi:MAG TPA: carboxypeptidase regulatory-like domain-containing protein, partial [Candidatus Aquilonibacter sp.]